LIDGIYKKFYSKNKKEEKKSNIKNKFFYNENNTSIITTQDFDDYLNKTTKEILSSQKIYIVSDSTERNFLEDKFANKKNRINY